MPEKNGTITRLGEPTRLSRSPIWKLQRDYYDQTGVSAWNDGTVPHHITNNPSLAGACARIVTGYVRDLRAAGALDREQPLYLVEIGAGAGRHGFLFLRQWERLWSIPALQDVPWVYVLADFTDSNLSFWRQHPQLQDYLERGVLDLARFDAENDTELRLERAGLVLPRAENPNPVVVIAHYVFDTLTQDVFRIHEGRLLESLAFPVSVDGARSLEDPDVLEHLDVRFEHRELVQADYYPREDWNQILRSYQETLGDTSVSLPVGAFRAVDHFLHLAGGRLLLLCADKAWCRPDEMIGLEDPELVLHGSFSMTVNFHALGLLFQSRGGQAFHSELRDTALQISAFVQDPRSPEVPETASAFEETINGFGPIDVFNLREAVTEALERPPLRMCLDLLRMSGWDPEVLYDVSERLADCSEDASDEDQREVRAACARVWQNHFHIGGDKDVAFELGRIFYRMECYTEAVAMYRHSLRLHGEDKVTRHNIGLCYYYMRRLGDAHAMFRKALELAPDYSTSRDWCLRIEAELMAVGSPSRQRRLASDLGADLRGDQG